eukprot:gnl/MRDRNA2_/MRDRNA2_111678_c0_seq1.p1 gnl/MRDRNA2_/MRDRNA2_111678_c0~~gnl/MRDRNA2_/MRDRNA2_111678_c0_seq1.p1  ORF type:complete len:872 (+),score=242.36 gnl/MRDRNA2_/MRDRNA2_111678_c0_seq1:123-2738(+)
MVASLSDDVQSLREELEAKTRAAALLQSDASNKARQIKRLMQAKQTADTRVDELQAQLSAATSSKQEPKADVAEEKFQKISAELEAANDCKKSLEATNQRLNETVKKQDVQIQGLKRELQIAKSSSGPSSSKGAEIRISQLEAQCNAADKRAERQDAVIKRLEVRLQERDTRIGELKGELTLASSSCVQQASRAFDVRIEELETERDAARNRAERLEAVVKRIDVRVQERDSRIQDLKNQLAASAASCLDDGTSSQVKILQLEAERDAAEAKLNCEVRALAECRGKLEALEVERDAAKAELNSEVRVLAECRGKIERHHELEPRTPGTGGSFLDDCCLEDDAYSRHNQIVEIDRLYAELEDLNDKLVLAHKAEMAKDERIAVAEALAQTEESELRRLRDLQARMSKTKTTGGVTTPVETCVQHADAPSARSIASPNRSRDSSLLDPMPADLGGLTAPHYTKFSHFASSPGKSPGKSPGNKRSPILAAEAEEFPTTPIRFMTRETTTPSTLSKVEEYPLTPLAQQLQDRDRDIVSLRSELRSVSAELSFTKQELVSRSQASQSAKDGEGCEEEVRANPSNAHELTEYQQECENLRSEVSNINAQLFSSKQELSGKASLIERLENESETQKSESAHERDKCSREKESLQSEMSSVALQLSSLQVEKRNLHQEFSDHLCLAKKLEIQAQAQKFELTAKDDSRHEIHELRAQICSMTSQFSSLQQQLSNEMSEAKRFHLQSEIQKSEIVNVKQSELANAQGNAVHLDRLTQELHEQRKEVEEQAFLAQEALIKELQSRDRKMEMLQSTNGSLSLRVSTFEQELSDKTSVVEDLEVQAQIQESELVDTQGQIEMKNRWLRENIYLESISTGKHFKV